MHVLREWKAARTLLISVVIFLLAHLALLIGIATPEKFVFDEAHYVPAARQMLESASSEPMLNTMHPPLAKQLIALSIRLFGDNSFAWRYPSALFGALAVVAIYLCGLAMFASHGPAIAAALIAFFNQMLFVIARTAMLDIFALTFGLSTACKWSGLFPLAVCIAIVVTIRLMRGWRVQFADGRASDWYRPDLWPDFRFHHLAACFVLAPAISYFADFITLYGLSLSDIIAAQRRIFNDNTTTEIAGHTYMSSWRSWPFLVRPVWFLFDKVGDDRVQAVVLLGNPLVLWPALPAIAICLRDWIAERRGDAFLILSFYFGTWLVWALLPRTLGFLYYYLPPASLASLALVYALRRRGTPGWLLWAYVAIAGASFVAMLPISAAFVGTTMRTFSRLIIFQNWI